MAIDINRFQLLLEYSLDGKTNLNVDDLVMICKLYLETEEDAVADEIKKFCDNLVGDGEISLATVLEKVGNPEDELTILLVSNSAAPDKEEKEETAPVLRGEISIGEDGCLKYEGKWAMDADSYMQGKKNRFKYTFQNKYQGDKKKIIPSESDGEMAGSFMMEDEDAKGGLVKVTEPSVTLTFEKDGEGAEEKLNVTGRGANKFGSFQFIGKYHLKNNKLMLEKFYQERNYWDDVEDDDEDDEEAEFGEEDEEESDEDEENDIDEAGGGQEELAALLEEATEPVEKVKKRYESRNNNSSSNSSKRQKKDSE